MNSLRSTLAVLAGACLLAAPALGTTMYPDYVGTNVSYTGIQETSTFGDPEPLFGAPLGVGNQLLFFPANFTASASGAAGFDQTGSQLQLTIDTNGPADVIDILSITEFGDVLLTGVGTAATGALASMSGFVTVIEQAGVAIAPVVIGFTGTFSPSALFSLPGDAGTSLWSGSVLVDIAAVVPNATRVVLSFDNDLTAYSEAGTSAKIQKKVVDGPAVVVSVIPEPGTLALLAPGLIGMAIRARRSR